MKHLHRRRWATSQRGPTPLQGGDARDGAGLTDHRLARPAVEEARTAWSMEPAIQAKSLEMFGFASFRNASAPLPVRLAEAFVGIGMSHKLSHPGEQQGPLRTPRTPLPKNKHLYWNSENTEPSRFMFLKTWSAKLMARGCRFFFFGGF